MAASPKCGKSLSCALHEPPGSDPRDREERLRSHPAWSPSRQESAKATKTRRITVASELGSDVRVQPENAPHPLLASLGDLGALCVKHGPSHAKNAKDAKNAQGSRNGRTSVRSATPGVQHPRGATKQEKAVFVRVAQCLRLTSPTLALYS